MKSGLCWVRTRHWPQGSRRARPGAWCRIAAALRREAHPRGGRAHAPRGCRTRQPRPALRPSRRLGGAAPSGVEHAHCWEAARKRTYYTDAPSFTGNYTTRKTTAATLGAYFSYPHWRGYRWRHFPLLYGWKLVCSLYTRNATRRLEDMNFSFSWWKYSTHSLRSFIKCCFHHSGIKLLCPGVLQVGTANRRVHRPVSTSWARTVRD